MLDIEKKNEALPEHKLALKRILRSHPPLERVSLTDSRFANVNRSAGVPVNYGPVGSNFEELLENLQADLRILQAEYDQTIKALIEVMPLAKNGGFAAMVLSGRAPLPEKVMHTVDQLTVYVQYADRACMTSIVADMQVYPKGLEWLPKPGWREK
jgi:hypothetical protein